MSFCGKFYETDSIQTDILRRAYIYSINHVFATTTKNHDDDIHM